MNLASINPISRALLKAKFPDGSYLVPSAPTASTAGRTEAAVRELPGRIRHSSDIRPGSVHDQRRPPATDVEQVEREVLLLEPAEPRSAGQQQRGDRPRARGDDLPADVLVHRPPRLRPERWSTNSAQASSATATTAMPMAYFTNAEFGIQNPLRVGVPDLTQIDNRGDNDVGGPFGSGRWPTAPASTTGRRPTPSATR